MKKLITNMQKLLKNMKIKHKISKNFKNKIINLIF